MLTVELGDRIATEVLPASFIKGAGGLPLIRTCACQYGSCGRCKDLGQHDQCTTRVGWKGQARPSGAAYIVSRGGGVVATVWPSGKPCSWRCPCACAEPVLVQLSLFDQDTSVAGPKPTGGLS